MTAAEALASRIRAERRRAMRSPRWARAQHGDTTFEVIKTTLLGQDSSTKEQIDDDQQDSGGQVHRPGASGT